MRAAPIGSAVGSVPAGVPPAGRSAPTVAEPLAIATRTSRGRVGDRRSGQFAGGVDRPQRAHGLDTGGCAGVGQGVREAPQTVEAGGLVGHDHGSRAGLACHERLVRNRFRASRTVLRLAP